MDNDLLNKYNKLLKENDKLKNKIASLEELIADNKMDLRVLNEYNDELLDEVDKYEDDEEDDY